MIRYGIMVQMKDKSYKTIDILTHTYTHTHIDFIFILPV